MKKKEQEKPVIKKAPIPVNGELQGWKRDIKEQLAKDIDAVIPPKLLKAGIKVLGSEKELWKWLRKKPLGLHPDRGMDIMHTKEGLERILRLLGQIEHGVF